MNQKNEALEEIGAVCEQTKDLKRDQKGKTLEEIGAAYRKETKDLEEVKDDNENLKN